MMTYRYLISYMTISKHETHRIISKIVDRNKPILTSKDVEEIEKKLKAELDVSEVALLSFSHLKGEI